LETPVGGGHRESPPEEVREVEEPPFFKLLSSNTESRCEIEASQSVSRVTQKLSDLWHLECHKVTTSEDTAD
jgi:hypothetical protein